MGFALVGLAACGGETSSSGNGTTAMSPEAPTEVHFTAKDFAFEGPDTIQAGMVSFVLDNEGPTWHHLQLVHLPDGMSLEDFQKGLAQMKPGSPPPPWLKETGGVNPPPPGDPARVTLLVEPGQYAVICAVDVPDHVPHFAKGMIKGLTVIPATAAPAPLPPSDLTLTLVDFAFSFSAPPTAGSHVIHVENTGIQAHELALFKLLPGKTMDDLAAWAQTYAGPAPVTAAGGVSAIEPGQVADVYVTLTPGQYAALCFVPDAKDGQPHLIHGMVLPFQIS
jgi:hypothetical protein